MAAVVDSSVLVASLHTFDTQHEKARRLLVETSKPIVVPEHVAAESATVLLMRAGKKVADEFVLDVIQNEDFVFLPSSPQQFVSAVRQFLQSRKKLSFVDCALLALAGSYEVLTFDRALARAIQQQNKP